MLPFFFILAIVMYCISYWLWTIAQTHPQNLNDVIQVVSGMLFVPGDTIFLIYRGILLVTAFYLFADFLYSGLRHSSKGHEKGESHKQHLKYIFPRKM